MMGNELLWSHDYFKEICWYFLQILDVYIRIFDLPFPDKH